MRPSFPAEISIADSPEPFDVEFAAMAEAPASLAAVVRVVEAFLVATRVGMFSKEPSVDRIGIEPVSAARASERAVRYLWRVGGVQLGSFRVLLNMLEVIHHVDGPLALVSLRSTTGYGERMNTDRIVKVPFPVRSVDLPFPVAFKQNLENSRDPVVRVEFETKTDDRDVDVLVPLFLAWDRIVVHGGYLNALEDRDLDVDVDESLSGQQTYLAATNSVEHLLYEFVGSAAAYDALVNLAVRIHCTFRPLASLEVE